MSSSKRNVKSSDVYRVLVTEVVPYETPLIFSSYNFYSRLKSKSDWDSVSDKVLDGHSFTIPYQYQANVKDAKKRELHLIHPASQIEVMEFYKNYFAMIVDRCSVSEISIRKPKSISSNYFESHLAKVNDELIGDSKEGVVDGFDLQPKYFCSFFSYTRYDKLHKFYSSEEFLNLEEEYEFLYEFDVRKCFYNIYTHSLAWAVEGKGVSKKGINNKYSAFGSKFDSLMRRMNYNETNGIVVGPEVSRIFSEIIMQDIDRRGIDLLAEKGYMHNEHFCVRRYIDNYFVFSHTEDCSTVVLEVFEDVLKRYKLYVNEAKSKNYSRPFVSDTDAAFDEIKGHLRNFFEDALETSLDQEKRLEVYRPRLARDRCCKWSFLVDSYRVTIQRNSLDSGDGVGLILGGIKERVYRFSRNSFCHLDFVDESVACQRFIDDLCRVMIYFVRTSFSVQAINLVVQTLVVLKKYFAIGMPKVSDSLEGWAEVAFSKIFLDLDQEGNILHFKERAKSAPLEFCNFLVIMKLLSPRMVIKQASFLELWDDFKKSDSLSDNSFPYWEAVSILYFVQDFSCFDQIKDEILCDYLVALRGNEFPESSDLSFSFLDFSSYPGFSKTQKERIWDEAFFKIHNHYPTNSSQGKNRKLYSEENKAWFINWDTNVDVLRALAKKELQTGY